MSYEGYTEYICITGHVFNLSDYETGTYEFTIHVCPICRKRVEYQHNVDQTNGYDESNPDTYPAKTKIMKTIDVWNTDHYGNKYALKQNLFKPDSSEWTKL